MRVELEIKDKVQDKLQALRRYNTKVQSRAFQPGDLVWQVRGEARKDLWVGKLRPNWEGPFRVVTSLDNGAYRLQELDGKAIPRTWNATHLKFYFSSPITRPGVVLFFLLKSFVQKEKNQGFGLRGFNKAHLGTKEICTQVTKLNKVISPFSFL